MSTVAYWEERAQRYSGEGRGLRAVCSYGMPRFYNEAIHLAQSLALRGPLAVEPGTRVLDVGCGVGRWSLQMASRGAHVTGVDLSATMIGTARRAAAERGLDDCRFEVADVADLELGRRFSLVLAVTVLQHVIPPERFAAAAAAVARHVEPGGRLVLLEAAPPRWLPSRASSVFVGRGVDDYVAALAANGLRLRRVTGVDPLPLKILFLPAWRRLPRSLAVAGLATATAASLPLELALGRSLPGLSWHKVMELERPGATS